MDHQPAATVAFVIQGTPVGKGRPKFSSQGPFVRAYTPEKTANYENLVKVKAEQAMDGRQMIEGPVEVSIRLIVTPPASWSKKKKRDAMEGVIFPTSKPDIDNVLKGIMDACNEIVFKDDKQAVNVRVVKRYGEVASAAVEVRPL
jgi:Holliday junction resolvase RusA-like endonuclease